MSDELNKMADKQLGAYFAKKNKEALERLKKKNDAEKPRLSPVSGEPMVTEVLHGVVIDRCEKSGGVWLDAGELEEILAASAELEKSGEKGWLESLMGK